MITPLDLFEEICNDTHRKLPQLLPMPNESSANLRNEN